MSHLSKHEDILPRPTRTQDSGFADGFAARRLQCSVSNGLARLSLPSRHLQPSLGYNEDVMRLARYLLSTRLLEPSAISDIRSLQQAPKSSEKSVTQRNVNKRFSIMLGRGCSCQTFKYVNQQSSIQTSCLIELQHSYCTGFATTQSTNTKFEFLFHNL